MILQIRFNTKLRVYEVSNKSAGDGRTIRPMCFMFAEDALLYAERVVKEFDAKRGGETYACT